MSGLSRVACIMIIVCVYFSFNAAVEPLESDSPSPDSSNEQTNTTVVETGDKNSKVKLEGRKVCIQFKISLFQFSWRILFNYSRSDVLFSTLLCPSVFLYRFFSITIEVMYCLL